MVPRITVSLQAELFSPGVPGPRPLAQNDVVEDDDGLLFRVWVDRPAYVNLIWYEPAGWSSVIYPKTWPAGWDQQLLPGAKTEVRPKIGALFYLDHQVGDENIYALAASKPVLAQDAALRRLLRVPDLRPGQRFNEDDLPPPPPYSAPPEGRGERRPRGDALEMTSGGDGIALLRLRLRHQR
jgi:hypothetical protein